MSRRQPANDLFGGIASFAALRTAAHHAVLGKRRSPGAANFLARLEPEILRLERELNDGSYRPGRYRAFEVFDPKRRMVSAAPFRDRVVHHALCSVIEPVFERSFIFDSYANRAGKGTHRAIDRFERGMNRFAYVFRGDIYRYFPAIDHQILKTVIRRYIACPKSFGLIERIIDASNPQEPVDLHFPGDDLLSPIGRRRGLPIGNLTSQMFANIYLDGLDHFCQEILGAKNYVRYMDDFALFHNDPIVLRQWRARLVTWLAGRRLVLHPGKSLIVSTRERMNFLGIELAADLPRRLADENVQRFRLRLRSMADRYHAGNLSFDEITPRIRSWIAHARHARTERLREAIFRGAVFHPPRDPDRAATAFSVAGPGTTIPRTFARPIATGTNPPTGTTTSGSVLPARAQIGAAAITVATGE